MRYTALALVSALALAGCAKDTAVVPVNGLQVVRTEALPPPSRSDLVAADRESLIGPLDTITLSVYGVEALNTETQVDSSGRISIPLVGTVDVRGKTAPEVSRFVERELTRYVKNPQVTVNVRNSASQVVTVDGEVEKPGLYPVTNQMTLMRAIASAEGIGEFGRTEDVVVLRTVDGHRMAGLYNLGAIRRGAYVDPPIYANDVVVVGDSPTRRLFKDLVSVAPLLTAPLVVLLQNN
jgi:polysaccharide export outer membrane protein